MANLLIKTAILTVASAGLIACGGGGGGGSATAPTTGTANLSLTDAAVDSAEQVLVQFTGVSLKPADGDAIDIPLAGDSQTCLDLYNGVEPTPTADGESTVRCIDLLGLQGTSSAALLENVSLEAGEYNWIRLDVDAARGVQDSLIVLDTGAIESLLVPSGSQSGLKLNTGFTILAGGSHDFMIDFDLRKSVNNPQGFADYRLKPSLRLIDLSASGNLVGSIDSSLLTAEGCTGDTSNVDGFAVYIYAGGEGTVVDQEGSENPPLTSASISLNGDSGLYEYTVGFLAPGEYTTVFTCQAGDDSAETADDVVSFVESADSPVTIVADQDSTVNFITSPL